MTARKAAQEQGQARGFADLVKLGYARGHKHPERWAAHIMTARAANARRG